VKKRATLVLLFSAFCFSSQSAWAEVGIRTNGSTGLTVEGLKGYIGGPDAKERIVITSDEPQAFLLFFWDSNDLALSLTVTDSAGKRVAELDLSKGNVLTLSKPDQYVCTLYAKKGAGHWTCIVMGSREWDP
jgi:hypothetical protein